MSQRKERMNMASNGLQLRQLDIHSSAPLQLSIEFRVTAAILFDLDIQVQLMDDDGRETFSHHIRQAGWDLAWLPAGDYRLDFSLPHAARGDLKVLIWSEANRSSPQLQDQSSVTLTGEVSSLAADTGLQQPGWALQTSNPDLTLDQLSWRRGYEDWFYRHFDHASRVMIQTFLDHSPKLKGHILDVGCGDGITDLGVFLRCQPQRLVGIDPFEGYQRLPEILEDNQLDPALADDPRLSFKPHSGNDIPYPDDDFDVVLSWGSLEHIAGGYGQTLREIRRVLRPGGLLFAHPGLYYGALGNHLGEFFDDPFIHLKLPESELRERVLGGQPDYMDRAGEESTPAQYWQWYTELNPITVQGFEQELRELGFRPWRVGLRSNDYVEYTDALQPYSAVDLCISEIYGSWILEPGQGDS